MSDSEPSNALETDLNPSDDFRQVAGPSATAEPERSVGATAKAELAVIQAQELALDRHELAWVRERERLAGKAQPVPSFDLGAQSGRDLKDEHDARRTAWTQQQGQIQEHYHSRRTQVRVNGRTVKDEFTESSRTTGRAEPSLTSAFNGEGQTHSKPVGAKALPDPQPTTQAAPQIAAGRGRSR